MTYRLPFTGDNIVELGGDLVNPVFRPNINSSPGPAVDIICDLNEGIPLSNEHFSGVFGSYVIEHIRTKKLRHFISECYRILCRGGYCVMVTANLLEQCRKFVEVGDANQMEDKWIHMIFAGDPDYPGNYHHTGFTPVWAVKLFTEAGFTQVNIYEHPNCKTDLIIEARK